MTDAELQRIESIAFTFDNPQHGVISSKDIVFLIRGYREALKSREKVAEVSREDIFSFYGWPTQLKEGAELAVSFLMEKYPNGIKIVDGGA